VSAPFDLTRMSEATRVMLRKSLDALITTDAAIAFEVLQLDETVDTINREMYALVTGAIRVHPEQMELLLQLLSVSRYLERIADHATSIAEDVIYMLKGDIVRHTMGSNSM
jgi:phosphate transport system protein